jgi:hypothetical protein
MSKREKKRKAHQAWASKHASKPSVPQQPEPSETQDESPSATTEEANTRLRDHSRVVSMKEEKMKKEAAEKKRTRTTNLPALPSLPKLRSARVRPTRDCECGCGEKTKSRFTPGHDSYQRAIVLRLIRKDENGKPLMTMDQVRELGLPTAQIEQIEIKVKEAKRAAKAAKAEKTEAPATEDTAANE